MTAYGQAHLTHTNMHIATHKCKHTTTLTMDNRARETGLEMHVYGIECGFRSSMLLPVITQDCQE